MTLLHLDVRVGDTLTIGDVRLRLEKKSGQVARFTIEADSKIRITLPHREIHFAHECDSEPLENMNHVEHPL